MFLGGGVERPRPEEQGSQGPPAAEGADLHKRCGTHAQRARKIGRRPKTAAWPRSLTARGTPPPDLEKAPGATGVLCRATHGSTSGREGGVSTSAQDHSKAEPGSTRSPGARGAIYRGLDYGQLDN